MHVLLVRQIHMLCLAQVNVCLVPQIHILFKNLPTAYVMLVFTIQKVMLTLRMFVTHVQVENTLHLVPLLVFTHKKAAPLVHILLVMHNA
jgi:hypothetical protein